MSLSYQQIHLLPRYSKNLSRSEIDTSITFGPRKFKIPVVPANMKCTIDDKLAKWMSENDYFYIMHRFGNTPETCYDDMFNFIMKANVEKWKTISISIGVQDKDLELLHHCLRACLHIDYITIDIAHGHSIRMKAMLDTILKMNVINDAPYIIAGNVATPEAVIDLESWGVDCVKVGIAQGGACTTYGQTGFGVPMFSCMLDCSRVAKKPLIADGGIKTNGDFAKALVAGGTMVMAGSMFASSIDSPAETVEKYFMTDEVEPNCDIRGGIVIGQYRNKIKKKLFKRYYGSASAYNKSTKTHIEGTLVELECDGTTYAEKLATIEGCIQSSISYGGGDLSTTGWAVVNQ